MAIKQIPLDDIVDNPFQPRTDFDQTKLQSLADEMKAEGFWSGTLQGRRTKNGKIELVFGHRRVRALKLMQAETVPIEIVDLTDAQMALRSLEENLQREGLSDLEKSDGVKQAVEIERARLRNDGKSESHAIEKVASRLGLGVEWVRTLCEISATIVGKNRELVEAGYITAKTAHLAKAWGGDAYVKTLAEQGKEAAKKTSVVSKPTEHTVAGMKKAVREASESVQDKLKASIIAGEVTTPAEAVQKGRRLAAERTRRNKLPPEDLETVIVGWTHRFEDWTQQLKEVVPYMEYIDGKPEIATPFRAAVKEFIATAKDLLEVEPAVPRSVGRGQTSAIASKRRRLIS
jgi:ParB/RepB/Spo0J family partition protein